MLTLEIDGQTVEVEDGATVMDAANKLGIYIPHFCYHKKLSIAANCRMCLVEVERAPKPLPACATPATNGMKVHTHSAKAVTAQKGVMEFLLINHPLDCPICDQGGECQLQDLAVGYGQSASRFAEAKRVVPNKTLGPLIETFMTRCINCTRCVRFLAEIGGYQELGQAFRGEHAEILPFLGQTVDSEISGNIIDLCPVGALTSKPFLYRARTWELTRRRSVSPHDAWGSNLIVQSKHDRVMRVLPLENDAINECWLSDRDRFAYEGLNAADRLTRPMVKRDGSWQVVDWQTALSVAVNRLRDVVEGQGAEQLAVLAHPMSTVEELYLVQQLAKALGGARHDTRIRQWDSRADQLRKGVKWLNGTIAGIATADNHWFLGAEPRRELPLMAVRLRAAAKAGAVVSSWGWGESDWRVPGLRHWMLTPAQMLVTLAQLLKAMGENDLPPWAAELANAPLVVSPDVLAQWPKRLAAGMTKRLWLGQAVIAHPQAAEFEWLAGRLAARLGATVGWLVDGANAVGADLVGANGLVTAAQLASAPQAAYLLVHLEPEDFPSRAQVVAACTHARTVVALTAYAGESLKEVADVLLPITPFTETSGSFVNIAATLQSFSAVVRPREEARPGWKVLAALAAMLDQSLPSFASSEAVRAVALPEGWRVRLASEPLAHLTEGVSNPAAVGPADPVTLYQGDPIVRRAAALQATAEGGRKKHGDPATQEVAV